MASEPVQAVAICGGDATAAMQMLASSSALSGLLQWALNPTFGKLSDIYGRKPFLMIGPSTNCLFNCLIATNPTNRRLFVALRVLGEPSAARAGLSFRRAPFLIFAYIYTAVWDIYIGVYV
jgi:MFS family permease